MRKKLCSAVVLRPVFVSPISKAATIGRPRKSS
jgi:hypothetical protein